MEIKPMVFYAANALNWHKWEVKNQAYFSVTPVY